MKKILIFPYSKEINPILNHIKLLKNVSEIKVIAFQTPSFVFEDRCISFAGVDSLEENIKSVDDVWIVNTCDEGNIDSYIENCIEIACKFKKRIRWVREEEMPEDLRKYSYVEEETINDWYEMDISKEIFPINVPVIFVMGLSSDLSKYDTLLSLKEEFDKQDVDAFTISAKQNRDFPEIEAIPEFYYNSNLNNTEKILMLNHYFKQIEIDKVPKLFLVEIPGGPGIYSYKLVNDFGIHLFCVSQAITPDCCIMNMPVDEYVNRDLQSMQDLMAKKFNVPIDYFNIVNSRLCIADSERMHKFSYLTVDNEAVDTVVKELDVTNVFNISYPKQKEDLVKQIISQLESYNLQQIL